MTNPAGLPFASHADLVEVRQYDVQRRLRRGDGSKNSGGGDGIKGECPKLGSY